MSGNDDPAEKHRRIRVVFSIGALHGGGSERQLVSLLRQLDRRRFEPFLYLIYRSGPLLSLVPDDVPVAAFEERVTPSRIYAPGLMHALRVADFAKYLREIRADVSYDRTFLMTLVSAAGAQKAGVPNVSTIVTDPETGFSPVAGRFQWIKRRKLHRLYERSSRVLAVSDGARKAAIRFYKIHPERIETLLNGVDTNLLEEQTIRPPGSESSDLAAWWNGDQAMDSGGTSSRPDTLRIVSAGRLNEQKGFHFLIQAAADLKVRFPDTSIRLCILGDGDWRDRLMQLVNERGLSNEVRMPGFQCNAAWWYRSADVFVLPSLIEGMPNVLLEAMALGTPVISADCPSGPREILEGGRFGQLVPPSNSKAICDALSRVLTDGHEIRKMSAEAAMHVKANYTIAQAARRLETLFTSLVEANGSPPK
ncbi:MAG: glycosyltransferase [Planctomycetaceae bacterium]|nr:glycosyltransferase [Planctomycetaceae bacterium]